MATAGLISTLQCDLVIESQFLLLAVDVILCCILSLDAGVCILFCILHCHKPSWIVFVQKKTGCKLLK